MILGIGADLVDIERFEAALRRRGEKLERRLFTAGEREAAQSRRGSRQQSRAAYYAKRFAAKEAAVKALGGAFGCSWQDVEISAGPNGAPQLRFHGKALARLNALGPAGWIPAAHLSLADERKLALAYVIIAAVPAP